ALLVLFAAGVLAGAGPLRSRFWRTHLGAGAVGAGGVAGAGSGGRPVQPDAVVPGATEDWGDAIWRRVRAGGIPAVGPGGPAGMAQQAAITGRGCGGPGHTGAAVHDGDVCGLRSGRNAGGGAGHGGNLPAGLCAGGSEWAAGFPAAAFEHRGRGAGRDQRGRARPPGRGFGAAGAERNRGLVYARVDGARRVAVVALSGELGLAGSGGRSGGWFDGLVGGGARALRLREVRLELNRRNREERAQRRQRESD